VDKPVDIVQAQLSSDDISPCAKCAYFYSDIVLDKWAMTMLGCRTRKLNGSSVRPKIEFENGNI
jgi:hypothetical protein